MIFWSVTVRVNLLLKSFPEGDLGGVLGTPLNSVVNRDFARNKSSFFEFPSDVRGGYLVPPLTSVGNLEILVTLCIIIVGVFSLQMKLI